MAARRAAHSDLKIKSQPASPAWVRQFLLFALFFAGLMLLHGPLLRLPYFWDEAGYYIPASRDLLPGSLIPHSTPSNAHPPLVMAWLALSWKIFDQSQVVTRCAMLLLAAFSLLGYFRLSRTVANTTVAAGSTALTAIYPVFFTQSSLAHVDLAAAGLIFWGLESYVRRRWGIAVLWFSLAVLAKETAVLAPLALLLWELVRTKFMDREGTAFIARGKSQSPPSSAAQALKALPDIKSPTRRWKRRSSMTGD